ncbi:sigma-E factor negative regulatory protein [Rodentibacter trehalosifermentans]|uniref:Anti-sigma-E factor RseA n=1 Tax=Rodentibacter trehalosifermentans TaxID=1908263 RepID=A0A1V3IVN1_9PAST|nr:sigma-E factor negative regulatory protein [Rodentibacter trehalosifermentans]OOF46334.1 transcriptional regulator [Rodentibacter trehalosifermentans]OOF48469.1 transcriptional regulator [Rodentibacter trehalosifermentans]OOF53243.1 transcriptional regulator [Rodentibacter trehalosifermentans]
MQKEQLSAYMDGEQIDGLFTKKLCNDESLCQSWAAYHMARAVIRKESAVILGADFTAKMAELIENETIEKVTITESQPTVEEVKNLPFMRKFKSFFAPVAQIAVAAGVCLVAVLGVQSFNAKTDVNNAPETPVLQTLPFNNSVQEVSYNAPTKDVAKADQMEQKNRRIGAMLQNYELQRRMHADSLSIGNNQVK